MEDVLERWARICGGVDHPLKNSHCWTDYPIYRPQRSMRNHCLLLYVCFFGFLKSEASRKVILRSILLLASHKYSNEK